MLRTLQDFLDANQVPYVVLNHPAAFTAQKVAAAEHVPGREHAKVTVIRAGSRYLMAVLPAPRKVDLHKLARLLPEGEVILPTEKEFESIFPGCEPGAMPPFGHLFGLEVLADRTLEKDQSIVFEAGTHRESVRMRFSDFKRLAKPRIAEFSR